MLNINFNKFDNNGNDTFTYDSFKEYATKECKKKVLIGALVGLGSGLLISYLIK